MDHAVVARWRVLCLVALGAFVGMSAVVFAVGLLPGDVTLHQEILEGRGTPIHAVALWLNEGGRWVVLGPGLVLLFAWSPLARRRWWLWCALMPVGGLVEQGFKLLVGRPRPRGINPGFPSGHVTAAATFAVILIYVLSRERARLSPAARAGLLVLAAALVVSVGYARVILNAHWPSDVLGGALLGTGCAAAGAWWDAAHPARDPMPGRTVDGPVRIGS